MMKKGGLSYKNIKLWLNHKIIPVTFTRNSTAYDGEFNLTSTNNPRLTLSNKTNGLYVEETTDNLFTNSLSQNFVSEWTSGTLNGTYTVSIQGSTGSLTLSGGATGTVTPNNPLTISVSNATVTFTPTGTPTYCQLEKKAFPTSWHIGAGTRAAEVCSTSGSYLPLTEGTIEIRFYNKGITPPVSWNFVAHRTGSTANRLILQRKNDGTWVFYTSNATTGQQIAWTESGLSVGLHVVTVSWSSSKLKLYMDGVDVGSAANNPYIPVANDTYLYIGSFYDGIYPMDTYITEFVVSNIERTPIDISKRVQKSSLSIDSYVNFALQTKNKLQGINTTSESTAKYNPSGNEVVLSFDDGLSELYTNARPIINESSIDIKPTLYVITDKVGTGGYLSLAQLTTLQSEGWLIANHTSDHTDLTSLNLEQQTTKINDALTWLTNNGFGYGGYHIAYPGGANNSNTATAMTNIGMRTGRTVTDGYLSYPTSNFYLLTAKHIPNTTTVADALAIVDTAHSQSKIPVLYLHNIVESPSTEYQWSTENFNGFIEGLEARNTVVLTMEEWYQKYRL